MKILVCHNYYAVRGGEAAVVENEMQLLQHKGHDVMLFSRDNTALSRMSLTRKISTLFRAFHNPHTHRELARYIASFNPDLVHVHNVFPLLSPSLYRYLYARGIPVVQTLHNFRFFCCNGLLFCHNTPCTSRGASLSCVRKRCYRNNAIDTLWYATIIRFHQWRRTFTHCIDRYIALNSFTRDIYSERGFPADKICVKPNSAREYNLPFHATSDSYAVFVGRLSEEKGLMTLLQAAVKVPSLPLRVIGDGPLEKDARTFVAQHAATHISFYGRLSHQECAQHVHRARVAVCPSLCYENCPLSIINALYCGTPVIASRIGGMADFVPENRAGWLIPPGDVAALTTALKRCAADPTYTDALRHSAYTFAHEHFNEEHLYTQLMEIYSSAIDAAKARSQTHTTHTLHTHSST